MIIDFLSLFRVQMICYITAININNLLTEKPGTVVAFLQRVQRARETPAADHLRSLLSLMSGLCSLCFSSP